MKNRAKKHIIKLRKKEISQIRDITKNNIQVGKNLPYLRNIKYKQILLKIINLTTVSLV